MLIVRELIAKMLQAFMMSIESRECHFHLVLRFQGDQAVVDMLSVWLSCPLRSMVLVTQKLLLRTTWAKVSEKFREAACRSDFVNLLYANPQQLPAPVCAMALHHYSTTNQVSMGGVKAHGL